jgi:uncharacterized protein (TIGR03085 family)
VTGGSARAERRALCDLLDEVGPGAPTLCDGWSTAHLAAHLVLRERRPDVAAGVVFGPLAQRTARLTERTAAGSFPDLVARLRAGPPLHLRPVDGPMNTVEFAVHHEDVRRAVDGWVPRTDTTDLQDAVWPILARGARLMARRLDDVALTLIVPDGRHRRVGSRGRPAALSGEPLELALFLYGRRKCAVVEASGDPGAIDELHTGPLGI